MNKADLVHRGISKAIDFIIMGMLARFPSIFGIAASAVYILTCDGFWGGRSIGKRLIGLRVVVMSEGEGPRPCGFRQSMFRNLLFAVVVVLGSIPILGLLFLLVGVILIAFEAYIAYADEKGDRVGDVLAGTHVIDHAPQKIT